MKGLAVVPEFGIKNYQERLLADYLLRIQQSELQQADNLVLMTEFNSNKHGQQIVISYLKTYSENFLLQITYS